MIKTTCTELDTNGCENDVMKYLYDAVVSQNYQRSLQPAIRLNAVVLPWFQPNNSWPFSGFDLSDLLDYTDNIQPNPEKAIMCEINTDSGSAVQLSACQSPHYSALKQHVERFYKRDGPVIIPAGEQLEWPVSRSILSSGIILSYSNTNRSRTRPFLDSLFEDETVCKGDSISTRRVCWNKQETQYIPMNPWMLGNFNPFEVCDIDFTSPAQGDKEIIYAHCAPPENAVCQAYGNEPIQSRCKDRDQNYVTNPGVPRTDENGPLAYNLCFHKLEESSAGCMHDQGLLGGYDGLPVAVSPAASTSMIQGTKYGSSRYEVAEDMYNNSIWDIPDDFKTDLWEDRNPLWSGQDDTPYGYLQVNESHIGGHMIGLVINRSAPEDVISTLKIERLPMQVWEDWVMLDSSSTGSGKVQDWVPGLQDAMRADHTANLRLFEAMIQPSQIGASCPLQRWAFYSGNYTTFSPVIPSPRRSQHLFWRMNRAMLAHPTMRQTTNGEYLGDYTTGNGFCACPVVPDIEQSQCLVPVGKAVFYTTDVTEACSLKDTVNALMATGRYYKSYVYQPRDGNQRPKVCTMQMDWPNVDGVMRDGSPFTAPWDKASSTIDKKCHVLDRLRPFQYRYKSAQTMQASGLNTNTRGSCQTGRVVDARTWKMRDSDQTRCVRTSLGNNYATIGCATSAYTSSLPRPVQMSVGDTSNARNRARQRCSKCSPPPAFQTNAGKAMPPESSFGRLYRPSAERLLAKDLRDTLCNVTGSCPAFNPAAWRTGQFMRAYLLDPSSLFLSQPASSISQAATQQAQASQEDPTRWTGRSWVYCPTPSALRTGQGCLGTMTRETWLRDRVGQCSRMVRSFSKGENGTKDQVARTPFCNIDNTTDLVCRAVEKAKQLVEQANCIASGDETCLPTPFVYHPASYEPSNNAWVYDTVSAYYTMVNGSSCPVTRNEQAFLNYMRIQDRACPAGPVQLVEGILITLRVIVTDMALMLSTLVSILVKLPAMIYGPTRPTVHQSILTDWAYLKKQGREMISTASDLFVDTLLNSGNAGLKIMNFLHTVCIRINDFVNFFLNVWCNYVQRYMIEMVAGLKHAMGIIGAGLQMFMDFMNYADKAILPAAFLQKYAQKEALSMLLQRFSQPSAHDDKVAAANRVPTDVNVRPAAAAAAERNVAATASKESTLLKASNTARSLTNKLGKAVAYLGVGGAVLAAGLQAFDMFQQMSLPDLAPVDFMLDELGDVVNVMDDMAQFLQKDQSCFVYQVLRKANMSYSFMSCLSIDINSYENSSVVPHMLSATQCWADASPDLGQNSLFSCTSSSSCCQTSVCDVYIPCGTCPAPALEMTNKFGCNALTKMCECGVAQSSVDSCSSNRQCDATRDCMLVSSLNRMNFGTIPCGQCPIGSMVMCLLPTTGFPGECACMLDSAIQYDICGETTGTITQTDATRLCAYIPGAGLSLQSWVFDLEDLIMAPCIQLDVGVCSTVHVTTTTALHMVVGTSLRSSQGRRRLLSREEEAGPYVKDPEQLDLDEMMSLPGWNATAEPCRSLAAARNAGKELGVLDTIELEKCAYWRFVGRRIVQEYNMTGLERRDTFLLSLHDFFMCMSSKDAIISLARSPEALLTALLSHPWLYPLQDLMVLIGNWARLWATRRERWQRDSREPAEEQDHSSNASNYPHASEHSWYGPNSSIWNETSVSPPEHTGPIRKILTVQEDTQNIQPFQAPPILQDVTQTDTILQAGMSALTSFSWPPVYDFSLDTCPAAMSIFTIGRQVVLVNKMYFTNFNAKPRPIDRSLRANLPDISLNVTSVIKSVPSKATSWASGVFHWVLDIVKISPAQIVAFFTTENRWTLPWILDTITHCDLASAVTCSEHRKDLVMSVVVFGMMYILTNTLSSAIGFPAMSTWLLLSFPGFILWYTFGLSPNCFPILPPCMLADIIAAVDMFLPQRITMPQTLLCQTTQNTTNAGKACLRPCSDLNFTTWVDTLAFTVCDIDSGICAYLANITTGVTFLDNLWTPAGHAMQRFQAVMLAPGYEPAGYRVCTWVTWITITPWLLLALSVLVTGLAVLEGVLALIPGLVEVTCRAFALFMTQ